MVWALRSANSFTKASVNLEQKTAASKSILAGLYHRHREFRSKQIFNDEALVWPQNDLDVILRERRRSTAFPTSEAAVSLALAIFWRVALGFFISFGFLFGFLFAFLTVLAT